MAKARVSKVAATIDSNDQKMKKLEEEKLTIVKKYEHMLERLALAESRNSELEERFDDLVREKKSLTEESYDLRSQHQNVDGGNRINETRIKKLEKQINEKEEKLKIFENRIETANTKIEKHAPKVEILESELEEEKQALKLVQEKRDESLKLIQELLS